MSDSKENSKAQLDPWLWRVIMKTPAAGDKPAVFQPIRPTSTVVKDLTERKKKIAFI